MGKGVAHLQPRIVPTGLQWRVRLRGLFGPVRAGPPQHPAKQALFGAGFQQPCAIVAAGQIGDAEPRWLGLFRGFARQVGGDATGPRLARIAKGADSTGGVAGRADRCAKVHDRLGVVAGAL